MTDRIAWLFSVPLLAALVITTTVPSLALADVPPEEDEEKGCKKDDDGCGKDSDSGIFTSGVIVLVGVGVLAGIRREE